MLTAIISLLVGVILTAAIMSSEINRVKRACAKQKDLVDFYRDLSTELLEETRELKEKTKKKVAKMVAKKVVKKKPAVKKKK